MANFNHIIQDDKVLLHLAVIEENLDVVKFLLKHDVPVNGRAINKHLSLEFMTDTEHQLFLNSTLDGDMNDSNDSNGNTLEVIKTTTALHLAARSESKDVADLLLQHGAEVNSEMEGGETPLVIAVISKRQNVVELLLKSGADVNAKTAWGKSPLHYAAQTGQKTLLEFLLKSGGHVNATSLEGLAPLHIAAEAGHKEVVDVLLKSGADLTIKTKRGATVLHYAAVMGHKDIVEAILAHGADINVMMKHGGLDLSPFKWITPAEEKKTWELVARYTTKMSIINWYNTMVMRLSKRSKDRKSLFQADVEQQQEQQQLEQQQQQ